MGELQPGDQGEIVTLLASHLGLRLMELGFVSGAHFEVLHQAPFGGDPIAVKVRGSVIAIRRGEANQIEVILRGETVTRGVQ